MLVSFWLACQLFFTTLNDIIDNKSGGLVSVHYVNNLNFSQELNRNGLLTALQMSPLNSKAVFTSQPSMQIKDFVPTESGEQSPQLTTAYDVIMISSPLKSRECVQSLASVVRPGGFLYSHWYVDSNISCATSHVNPTILNHAGFYVIFSATISAFVDESSSSCISIYWKEIDEFTFIPELISYNLKEVKEIFASFDAKLVSRMTLFNSPEAIQMSVDNFSLNKPDFGIFDDETCVSSTLSDVCQLLLEQARIYVRRTLCPLEDRNLYSLYERGYPAYLQSQIGEGFKVPVRLLREPPCAFTIKILIPTSFSSALRENLVMNFTRDFHAEGFENVIKDYVLNGPYSVPDGGSDVGIVSPSDQAADYISSIEPTLRDESHIYLPCPSLQPAIQLSPYPPNSLDSVLMPFDFFFHRKITKEEFESQLTAVETALRYAMLRESARLKEQTTDAETVPSHDSSSSG